MPPRCPTVYLNSSGGALGALCATGQTPQRRARRARKRWSLSLAFTTSLPEAVRIHPSERKFYVVYDEVRARTAYGYLDSCL